jgi:predicted ATPase/DNA-binding CsgD family transcriptional regulator
MVSGAHQVAGARGFPPALTSFVGRRDELDRLHRLLSMHRLVTVIGPGGVGKTRLAAEVTRGLDHRFGDRIWLVELASTSTPQQVGPVVAARLGVQLDVQNHAGRSMAQAVADVLVGEPALLVLDNCEHVVDAVAEFCSELLARCDDVVVLATSREPVGIAGEARLRLRPLPARTSRDDAGEPAGVALFLDRVRLADPAFELSAESAAVMPHLVARLDGLPLAIELAAARVESFGMEQLYARLAAPFRVLAHGPRTVPPRHRSLRATVDWSYQLMRDPARRVFRRLAVLPGPFTLAAAETIAGSEAESSVPHLVDCSLLTPPRAGTDGQARYLMLETVRAFALERLDGSGERDDAESAMISWAERLASGDAAGMRTPGGEAAAARRLDAEEPLLREALSSALERDPAAAVRLAVGLAPWWQLRGRALTGYPVLDRAVAGYADRDDLWRAGQKWLGRLAHSTAAFQKALTHFDTVCASAGPDAPTQELVDGLVGKSGSLRNLGRLDEAGQAAHAALLTARRLDYTEGEALALAQLSLVADYADDAEGATRWARQAAQLDRSRLPDKVARRVGLSLTVALAESDDVAAAREACAAGLESARAAGDVTMLADFLYFTTHVALREGQLEDAGDHICESLRLTAQSGDLIRILDCLDDCARLCAATGRPSEAVTLWAAHAAGVAALGTPNLAQDTRHRREPLLRATRRLGPDAARAAERRGAQMTLQTAADFAAMLARSAGPGASTATPAVRLTPREKELLVLVARGRTDAQIAAELFISIRTVRSHLDRIRDKTGSRRRADLTMLALRAGLV